MKTWSAVLGIAAIALASISASAQGPGPGPGPGASAPGMGMGMGPGGMGPGGMGPGRMGGDRPMRHHADRWGPSNTPGWGLMTPAERSEHRDKMRAMKTQGECSAYMTQHHEQMAARAKEKGTTVPAMPRRDPCARLPK